MDIGVRDLKNNLSRHLKKVQGGETIVVTEHGRPVARIIPAGLPSDIELLLSRGRITWSGGRLRAPARPVPLKAGVPLSDYITEDRR